LTNKSLPAFTLFATEKISVAFLILVFTFSSKVIILNLDRKQLQKPAFIRQNPKITIINFIKKRHFITHFDENRLRFLRK